ncbi:hypothetical protein niasHT_029312 [Heterodera trifolii]|uniref:Nucleoprotein TPR n=1 Tax=Heterodera trifolii TaxID=157864 RepID=A0ABD2KDD1_9BILA
MDNNDPTPSSTQQQHSVAVDPGGGSTMETADSSVNDQLKSIDEQKRIAQLEHEIFTVCKQLDEKSEKFKEVQDQNALLKDRVGALEQGRLEASLFTESLVKSNDALIQEKTSLKNDLLGLEKRKDELEMQVSKLSNEKRRHLGDIDELRQKCDKLSDERVHLQIQIDDFQGEKTLVAYDKEQWKQEKEILLMSKQWYMNEITDREQKINDLRIQLIKDKSDMQRELALYEQRSNELTAKADQLQDTLLDRERELDTLRDQFKKSLSDQTSRLNELEAELRARERLANVYKANSEAANAEIAELNDTEVRLQAQLKEAEQIVHNYTAEMERAAEEQKKTITEKDAEIKRLNDEVVKSTELLNAGFRLNRADEDLIQLSPAAAVASSLLKSGMSLTSIYAEHCRVVAELDKKNDEFKQLERYVTELIEELDSKAPKFQEQRKAYEQICERNECLRLQNDLLSKERQKLQTNADALHRELMFTKRELERYQREHNLLTIQVQRLLFIVEKGPEALEYNNGTENGGNDSDEYLFNNIRELHTKNIELAEALERMQENQDKIIANYHNTEIESLKQANHQAQDDLRLLRDNYAKQELLIRELSEQREQYRQLYEQQQMMGDNTTPATAGLTAPSANSNASSLSSAATTTNAVDQPPQQMQKRRESLDTLQSELYMWRSKAERLQETLSYVNDDRQTNEKTLNERIEQQLEQISSIRATASNRTIEALRNELASKEMELLEQAKSLSEAVNKSEDERSKYEQQQMTLEKTGHEAQLKVAQCQAEIEKLQLDCEQNLAKFTELSDANLRLTTDLAREIAKTEEFERRLADTNNVMNAEREQHQQSLQMLRLNDEIKEFVKRDEENVQKQGVYLDEIQKLVQQNSFMERLNQTIASPTSSNSLNASFIAGTPNTSYMAEQQQQQHSDRMNVIIGYMRAEKQKETEMRMNAELELQRIRTQATIDQHKIVHMEAEVAKLRAEAEAGARVAVEKAQLLTQLNALCEVKSRYQQLNKTHEDVSQRFAELEGRTRELEQAQLTAQADKRNLDAQIEAATKELATRTQENKNLMVRYNKAMAIASKYSPELVHTLQGDNEKLQSSLAQREKEVQLLNAEGERLGDHVKNLSTELAELKTKSDKLTSELSAVKTFARKFRDERNKLELENKELEADLKGKNEELVRLREQSAASALETTVAALSADTSAAGEPRSPVPPTLSGAVPGAIAAGALSAIRAAVGAGEGGGAGADNSLRRRMDQLMKEKQELLDKVKKLEEHNKVLQRELDESNEKVTRMDMAEKLLKSTQKN